MKQEELVKSELLRCSSLSGGKIGEAENVMIRSRLAREWDLWMYWWNRSDVSAFFHTTEKDGDKPRIMGWLLPLSLGEKDVSFEDYRENKLKDQNKQIISVKEAKAAFKDLRLLQKQIEDAFHTPRVYNYVGAILCWLTSNEGRFTFLDWYFKLKRDNLDDDKCMKELERYFNWSLLGVTHQEIVRSSYEAFEQKYNSFFETLQDNNLYNNKDGYECLSRWLLCRNINEDNSQGEKQRGRKFDFDIWRNRSLEHIFAKSKVWHLNNEKPVDYAGKIIEREMSELENDPSMVRREDMVAKDEHVRMLDLEKDINSRVFGQQDAIKQVSDTLVCSYVLPNHSLKRPQSVMLFLGPSGVGKTETAKTIAELLGRKFTSLNMNEYQTDIDVSRLMGSAPGYVGYEEGGKLTNFVSKNPCSVVLFDEFEKAHPNVQKILLQIFDQGTCTNNYGDDISFKNTIIILASNAGSVYDKPMGYSNNAFVPEVRVDEESISKIFMPEFLGRINRIVKFNALSKPVLMDIVNRLVSELSTTLKQDHNVNFVINDDVKNFIINQGYKPELGARKIQNTFVELIEQPVSYQIIQNYTNWHQPNGKLKKVKNPHELIAQMIDNKINFISK